jgi:UDP-2,3-diacylglucosamine hydrolase
VRRFLDFLSSRAAGAEVLYILGDLFDAWIGDDHHNPAIDPIQAALLGLTQNGTDVRLMHGNRDFLIGQAFCSASGVELIPDPTLTEFAGERVLLMHGDLLCTDDHAYQAFRRQVREPRFIEQFLSLSIEERVRTAAEYRAKSGEANARKAEEIMDVNQQTVEATMLAQGAFRLIHGHTHRPALHKFDLQSREAWRCVLPEWQDHLGGVLCITEQGWRTESFPI